MYQFRFVLFSLHKSNEDDWYTADSINMLQKQVLYIRPITHAKLHRTFKMYVKMAIE